MVEFEEAGEQVGVLSAVLQVADQLQLPFHEALTSLRETDEHRVDAGAQVRLFEHQPYGVAMDVVERTGNTADR